MRDDFSLPIKDLLAKRVGYICSNPRCPQPTIGPQVNPNKTVNIGVAAHITAASPKGPRYDESLTETERKAASNGIWLCQKCAKLVDNDPERYNSEKLRAWKTSAEHKAITKIEKTRKQKNKEKKKTTTTKWILVLNATVDEVNREKAEAIVEHLKKISGDTSMTLVRIQKGSVVLTIKSSLKGYRKIESLFISGNLKQIKEIAIKNVRTENNHLAKDLKINSISLPNSTSSIDAVEFLDIAPRLPLLLILDISVSMSGEPIQTLNKGLIKLKEGLIKDDLAKQRIEVAIITFGSEISVVRDFTKIHNFFPPTLHTSGATSMGAAINQGLDLIQKRVNSYKGYGVDYYRPNVFLITDGQPTDDVKMSSSRLKEEESKKKLSFFAIGLGDVDMKLLADLSSRRPPLRLKGLKFREMFGWLSTSMISISHSQPGSTVIFPSPYNWAEEITET